VIGIAVGLIAGFTPAPAVEPGTPPRIDSIQSTPAGSVVQWSPYPSTIQYRLLRTPSLDLPLSVVTSGSVTGFSWSGPETGDTGFYQLEAMPMSDGTRMNAQVLNRLAYGPTPDELERLTAVGADAYIQEQLAPESISEDLSIDQVVPIGGWRYVTVTGVASSSRLYIYLTSAGESYVDDLKLVAGSVPETGANLVRNGDFEGPLTTNNWNVGTNVLNSSVTGALTHGGGSSLHLVATAGSTGTTNSIWQDLTPALVTGQPYTLSYWYYAPSNRVSNLTIRLSNPSSTAGALASTPDSGIPLMTRLENGWATLNDLRAWHGLHAVRSRRQLLEVLDQFLENHFVTQHSKSRDYLDRYYDSGTQQDQLATRMEWVENRRWREALLDPQCTFHDLLRISAESPAIIIYLDTVSSRGDGGRIANENYARELFELFCQGVDNGYDQADIVEMSKVWTGWRIRLVDPANEFDPFAAQSTNIVEGSTNTSLTTISNLAGVWAFSYQSANHNTNNKTLFAGKSIPARFGAPYTTRTYGSNPTPGQYQYMIAGRSGAAGIQEGYEAMAYLADLPFTQEFMSVKLCRLFVHDDFMPGVYDYTDPNLSEEGKLVWACMRAWDTSAPRGQIRTVLRTIFDSALFRGQDGPMQKVKTPLEFTVSAIRALRAQVPGGAFTADTDGYSLSTPLNRMGGMGLFNRGDPDGYPESAPGWISAGTLAERLRFVEAFCIALGQSGHTDAGNCICDPVGLLKLKLPEAQWSDAAAVADYFLSVLYPGEGTANLDLHQRAAIQYLDTADNGTTPSPFTSLSSTTTAYDTRVRGMVAMLLGLSLFQEQ
jgi:uncharacterized protein (DUF1800 family)